MIDLNKLMPAGSPLLGCGLPSENFARHLELRAAEFATIFGGEATMRMRIFAWQLCTVAYNRYRREIMGSVVVCANPAVGSRRAVLRPASSAALN
jgi:hypothetical protein